VAKQRTKLAEAAIKTAPSAWQETVNSAEIAALAHHLWQARGCPVGSPEIDWFRAEQQLIRQTGDAQSSQVSEPMLVRRSGS
jgi:hypothetical protein